MSHRDTVVIGRSQSQKEKKTYPPSPQRAQTPTSTLGIFFGAESLLYLLHNKNNCLTIKKKRCCLETNARFILEERIHIIV